MSATASTVQPLLIAGPCAAESREQVFWIAESLKDSGIRFFRSGIWKPRSRPGHFEGIGSAALQWLADIEQSYPFKACVEVANTEHAEDILRHGISAVWIGARTSVNPFLVSEIAEALRGSSVQVMIKNPVNPDLELWIGAIERFARAGFEQVMAIHRGFSQFGRHRYRNEPAWEIPLELKRRMPHLTLLCDPSHIAGKRELLFEVAQKAADLGYNGLMIETHSNPDAALSDSAQQITPAAFVQLIQNITWRNADIRDPLTLYSLEQLRKQIDQIDQRLLQLIAERMQIAEKIGEVKKEQDIQIFQHQRWNEILSHVKTWSAELHLSEDLMIKLYEYIHQESIRKQSMVMYGRIINEPETE